MRTFRQDFDAAFFIPYRFIPRDQAVPLFIKQTKYDYNK